MFNDRTEMFCFMPTIFELVVVLSVDHYSADPIMYFQGDSSSMGSRVKPVLIRSPQNRVGLF